MTENRWVGGGRKLIKLTKLTKIDREEVVCGEQLRVNGSVAEDHGMNGGNGKGVRSRLEVVVV